MAKVFFNLNFSNFAFFFFFLKREYCDRIIPFYFLFLHFGEIFLVESCSWLGNLNEK
jgi:hypothetical protein